MQTDAQGDCAKDNIVTELNTFIYLFVCSNADTIMSFSVWWDRCKKYIKQHPKKSMTDKPIIMAQRNPYMR